MAFPADTPVTVPLEETLATLELEDFHVVLPEAFKSINLDVLFTFVNRESVIRCVFLDSFTVTLHWKVFPPYFMLIVATPAFLAYMLNTGDFDTSGGINTTATAGLDERKLIILSDGTL